MNGHLRRRAGNIHQRQAQRRTQIFRKFRVNAGFKQNGVRFAENLFRICVNACNFIDFQWRQGKGYQRCNAVPHFRFGFALQRRADFFDRSNQNSAGFGHRVLKLAPLLHNFKDLRLHLFRIAAALLPDASKRRSGGLQRFHSN